MITKASQVVETIVSWFFLYPIYLSDTWKIQQYRQLGNQHAIDLLNDPDRNWDPEGEWVGTGAHL